MRSLEKQTSARSSTQTESTNAASLSAVDRQYRYPLNPTDAKYVEERRQAGHKIYIVVQAREDAVSSPDPTPDADDTLNTPIPASSTRRDCPAKDEAHQAEDCDHSDCTGADVACPHAHTEMDASTTTCQRPERRVKRLLAEIKISEWSNSDFEPRHRKRNGR